MKKLFLFLFISCLFITNDVLAVYDLPSDRRISWNAGLDPVGGIPNFPSVTCTGLHNDKSVDDTAAINACIAKAAVNTAVFIPAGTYRVDGIINMKSNVVLRGAGAGSPWLPNASSGTTTLVLNGGGVYFRGGTKDSGSWQPGPGLGVNITSGYSKGSSSITLSDASSPVNFAVGDYISIFQDDDTSIIGYSVNGCSWCGEDNGNYHVKQQYSKVTGRNGNVLTINPPIYYATPSFTGAQVRRQIFNLSMAGIENLKLYGNGTNGYLVRFYFARHSWIKNVETYNTGGFSGAAHISIWFSYGIEVRDSYVHHGTGNDSGQNYGIISMYWNSSHKIENNVVRDVRHSIINEGGGSGYAVLYNDTNDNWESTQGYKTTPDTGFLSEDVSSNHGPHPNMNLYEGNIMSSFWGDFTMGSSSHITAFRNHIRGERDTPTVTGPWLWTAVEIEKYNRYYNLVGNVIGMPSWTTGTVVDNGGGGGKPVVYRFGYNSAGGGYTDIQSYNTATKHGNYDYITDGVAHWDGGSDHVLANSMYYSTKPVWWCNEIPWPPIGPDVTSLVNDIPAKRRYNGSICTQSYTQSITPPKIPAYPIINIQ